MKKLFLSAIAAAALFSACSSDDVVDNNGVSGEKGTVKTTISFSGVSNGKKAALSTVVPTTSWADIKDLKMFLIDATTGAIKTSKDINIPSGQTGNYTDTWTGIDAGRYEIVLLANIKPQTSGNTVANIVSGTEAEWVPSLNNVNGKIVTGNTPDVYITLKEKTLPAGAVFTNSATSKAFSEPTEIFAAYSDDIVEVSSTAAAQTGTLSLKREVSMMRVRIYQEAPNANGEVHNTKALVDLQADKAGDGTLNVLSISRMPNVAYAFAYSTFVGGLPLNSRFDENKAIVIPAATSTPIYGTAAGYSDDEFELYRDVIVFPNIDKADAEALAGQGISVLNNAQASASNQYWIQVSALAKEGYIALDENGILMETPLTTPQIVYWGAKIDHVFAPNFIREVNLKLVGPGSTKPVDPRDQGSLEVTVGEPIGWDSNILDTTIEM